MTDMTQPEGTTADAAQQATTQPDAAGDQTGGEQTGGEQTATAPDAASDATERPGDIPFDQAAAEHENPALE